ncbi:primase C-terminal domain-containing protein, partial [Chloroflexota bacterium]
DQGTTEGQRHNLMVSYIGYLISIGHTKHEISHVVNNWNNQNKPPLPVEEVAHTIDSCWQQWGVPKFTNTNTRYVNFGTRQAKGNPPGTNTYNDQRETPSNGTHSKKKRKPCSPEEWELGDPVDWIRGCGKWSKVFRKQINYIPIRLFCGKWECPRCASRFREKWVKHLSVMTKLKTMYAIECTTDDWDRVRKQIGRADAEYVKISHRDGLMVIVDRPMNGSNPISQDDLETLLDKAEPNGSCKRPISTSRGWDMAKEKHRQEQEAMSNEEGVSGEQQPAKAEAIARTWLPVYVQREVAQSLDAKLLSNGGWTLPEGTDQALWEKAFKEALQGREMEVRQWLREHKGVKRDIAEMELYMEDDLNEFGGGNGADTRPFGQRRGE